MSGLDEMRRAIREKEPHAAEHAAERLDAGGADHDGQASAARTAASCVHALRGDLDWIVMKRWRKTARAATTRPSVWPPT